MTTGSTTTPAGTLTIRVKLGSTIVLATGVLTAVSGIVNRAFDIQFIITCRTAGAPGTVFAQGTVLRSTGDNTSARWEMVNTSTTGVITTGALALNVTAQWGTAHASNTITATNTLINVLN